MPIFVGLLTVDLYIAEANSLKEKRRVLESLLTRVQNRLNVAVAEVGEIRGLEEGKVSLFPAPHSYMRSLEVQSHSAHR